VSLWWAIWTGFILNNFVIVRTVLDDFDESIRADQVSGAYDHMTIPLRGPRDDWS
jgi:hypothetical protein